MHTQSVSNRREVIISIIVTAVLLVLLMLGHRNPEFPQAPVAEPNIALQLPDFAQIKDIKQRKAAFFGFLRPIIRLENLKIEQQRAQLQMLTRQWQSQSHAETIVKKLRRLARSYDVAEDLPPDEMIGELNKRIAPIPEALVLAQAANESGWGTSRFAREANNLFGQWCFKKGCGLVPSRRNNGSGHEVRRFRSVRESVASYMKNLNTHRAYAELREIRAELIEAKKPVTALALVEGLHRYSERGDAYVTELKQMINYNGLE